jgi:hypothetical protein
LFVLIESQHNLGHTAAKQERLLLITSGVMKFKQYQDSKQPQRLELRDA